MSDVTRILSQIESGDPRAADQLLPLVYEELRKLAAARLAHENPGQTLQATALVHEAYLRLVGEQGASSREPVASEVRLATGHGQLATGHWHSRGHFFAAAAEAMRRILIENARRKRSQKAGGGFTRIDLDDVHFTIDRDPDDLLALDDSLAKLAAVDGPAATLAKLRLFAGLTVDEAADCLGISRTTGFRHWTYARAFLQADLQPQPPDAAG